MHKALRVPGGHEGPLHMPFRAGLKNPFRASPFLKGLRDSKDQGGRGRGAEDCIPIISMYGVHPDNAGAGRAFFKRGSKAMS